MVLKEDILLNELIKKPRATKAPDSPFRNVSERTMKSNWSQSTKSSILPNSENKNSIQMFVISTAPGQQPARSHAKSHAKLTKGDIRVPANPTSDII
jgi:hypothetical protein